MSNMALTPSAINKYLKTIIEKDKHLKLFDIKGEISNLKYHSNGNVYFSIKDNEAAINCIMFSSNSSKLTEKFKEGDKILATGSIYLYVKAGQYNINIVTMKKVGAGDLYAKFEELKAKLQIAGYFEEKHKKKIPKYPQTICVVTSSTGAAIEDIVTTIKRRFPICKINLLPTLVQGQNGVTDIVNNIKYANKHNLGDVMIVGRGGGSIEDLWNFNEEIVVQAIFQSRIPVISSVGHETDFTLSDFVSDVRAATPTAAAELATPDIMELKFQMNDFLSQSVSYLKNKLQQKKLQLKLIEENQYFSNPIMKELFSFDHLENEFETAKEIFKSNIKLKILEVDNNYQMMNDNILFKVNNNLEMLDREKILLDELNPLTILSKGYSVSNNNGKIIKSIKDVKIKEQIETKLKDGVIISVIKEIKSEKII